MTQGQIEYGASRDRLINEEECLMKSVLARVFARGLSSREKPRISRKIETRKIAVRSREIF